MRTSTGDDEGNDAIPLLILLVGSFGFQSLCRRNRSLGRHNVIWFVLCREENGRMRVMIGKMRPQGVSKCERRMWGKEDSRRFLLRATTRRIEEYRVFRRL